MENQFNIINLFLNSSLVAQAVMVLLIIFSVYSWSIIIDKWISFKSNNKKDKKFMELFMAGVSFEKLIESIDNKKKIGSLEFIFKNGFKKYKIVRKDVNQTPESILLATQRSMIIALQQQLEEKNKSLTALSIIASASPYIGLFGTVWGIMSVFFNLGLMSNASLQVIAPGISEALIATALGLFAAIPALISYNNFITTLNSLEVEYQNFLDDLISILQHDSYKVNK